MGKQSFSPEMQIAYLILAHHQPNHLARLIRALDGPECSFFVHIDAKADEAMFRARVAGMGKVAFVKQRQEVNWGGYSMIQATLALLAVARESGRSYDRFSLLSGSDFPIKPNAQILSDFGSAKEFIRVDRRLALAGADYHDTYVSFYWFMDAKDQRLMRLSGRMPRVKPLEYEPLYQGSQWWALTRDCIDYVLRFVATNERYCAFFQETQCPDEIFFQTIVKQSPFASRITHDFETASDPVAFETCTEAGCHFIDWYTPSPTRPKVLDLQDFDRLVKSKCLFARKFDEVRSRELIEWLARMVER